MLASSLVALRSRGIGSGDTSKFVLLSDTPVEYTDHEVDGEDHVGLEN